MKGYYRSMKQIFIVLILIHISSLCASCAQTVGNKPQTVEDVFLSEGDRVNVEVWIENLQIPWSLPVQNLILIQ